MGVPGLWDILNKVGKSTSIVRLSVQEGFDNNQSRRRAYRVGVDASIWFHHATFSKQGENPETRGLFFRLIYLAKLPIIPLFVFDGRERPKIKRGSKMGKSGNHPREKQFKHLLDAFGMEWREARGEAEAELAYLNNQGHIDAVITDDCDAFLFGARTIIKNISSKLSGNKNNLAKNSKDKVDKFHTMIYKAEDIENDPFTSLSRGDLILFALLAGGDYHKGVERVGKKIALGLARCGFGKELLEAYQNLRDYKAEFEEFLRQWRMRVNAELKHNIQGHLPHRTTLSLPGDFPNRDVLEFYANPLNSGSAGGQDSNSMALRDRANLDLPKVAHVCEQYFEWGYRPKIIERFRNLIWPCAVMHVLRRAALEVDYRNQAITNATRSGPQGDVGTPASLVQKYLCSSPLREGTYDDLFVNKGSNSRPLVAPEVDAHPLVNRIIKSRQHVSTDGLLEYQVEISATELIQLSNSGIKGTRQAPVSAAENRSPKKTSDTDPLILWVPAVMISVVHPTMVKHFTNKSANKSSKVKGKFKGKANEQEHADTSSDSASEGEMSSVLQHSELQQRSRSQPWSLGQNSYTEVLKPTYAPEGLDPWFTSNSSQDRPLFLRKRTSGFLFTIPNPDEDECVELKSGDYDNGVDCLAITTDSYDSEVGRPTSKFERIIDGILTKKRKPAKDPRKPSKSEADVNTTDERPFKKRQMSSRLLDALDAVELS